MKRIIYVLGTTCTGKTTLIREIDKVDDFWSRVAHTPMLYRQCLIGHKLRNRHPPEFFDGLGAMPETEPEVVEILRDSVNEFASDRNAEVLLVDGAPRLLTCLDEIIQIYRETGIEFCFALLVSNRPEVIEARARQRDGNDPAKLDLTLRRIINDKVLGYDILAALMQYGLSDRVITLYSDLGITEHDANYVLKCSRSIVQSRREPICTRLSPV